MKACLRRLKTGEKHVCLPVVVCGFWQINLTKEPCSRYTNSLGDKCFRANGDCSWLCSLWEWNWYLPFTSWDLIIFTQEGKIFHDLLTLMLFQTCMAFFCGGQNMYICSIPRMHLVITVYQDVKGQKSIIKVVHMTCAQYSTRHMDHFYYTFLSF